MPKTGDRVNYDNNIENYKNRKQTFICNIPGMLQIQWESVCHFIHKYQIAHNIKHNLNTNNNRYAEACVTGVSLITALAYNTSWNVLSDQTCHSDKHLL